MDKLQHIAIKNFQSIKEAEFDVGDFTCIVGPSDVGKSAIIRSLKMLIRNGPATGLVRNGQKQLELKATLGDTVETVVRSAKKSEFSINDSLYAKAGTAAPEAIADLWALPKPDDRELCITSQHDAPFLLAEPASALAKVLGELTNATMLMRAVQEANRRRAEAATDEKSRSRELAEIDEELTSHGDFEQRKALVEKAKQASEVYLTIKARCDKMTILSTQLTQLDSKIAAYAQQLEVDDSALQALEEAEKAAQRLARLEALTTKLRSAEGKALEAKALAKQHLAAIKSTEQEIHDKLETAGICPLCGNDI